MEFDPDFDVLDLGIKSSELTDEDIKAIQQAIEEDRKKPGHAEHVAAMRRLLTDRGYLPRPNSAPDADSQGDPYSS